QITPTKPVRPELVASMLSSMNQEEPAALLAPYLKRGNDKTQLSNERRFIMSSSVATRGNVLNQLMYDHDFKTDDDGNWLELLLPKFEAEALIEKHKNILEKGIRLGSTAHYVANEILKEEEAKD